MFPLFHNNLLRSLWCQRSPRLAMVDGVAIAEIVVKQLATWTYVDFDHHCDLSLVKIINSRYVPHVLPPFSSIRDCGKQNTRWNVSKNLRQSCVLLTDRIKIHQLQLLVWPSYFLYVMLSGCDWWISIRSVNNARLTLILETLHWKIMCMLLLLARGSLIKPVCNANKYCDFWAKLWCCLYSSYPLSRLQNEAYPGPAVLFSTLPQLNFLSSCIPPPFLLSSRQTYVEPSNGDANYHIAVHHQLTRLTEILETFLLVFCFLKCINATLESWYTNLEQTTLNRCQQLPAPYKQLIHYEN